MLPASEQWHWWATQGHRPHAAHRMDQAWMWPSHPWPTSSAAILGRIAANARWAEPKVLAPMANKETARGNLLRHPGHIPATWASYPLHQKRQKVKAKSLQQKHRLPKSIRAIWRSTSNAVYRTRRISLGALKSLSAQVCFSLKNPALKHLPNLAKPPAESAPRPRCPRREPSSSGLNILEDAWNRQLIISWTFLMISTTTKLRTNTMSLLTMPLLFKLGVWNEEAFFQAQRSRVTPQKQRPWKTTSTNQMLQQLCMFVFDGVMELMGRLNHRNALHDEQNPFSSIKSADVFSTSERRSQEKYRRMCPSVPGRNIAEWSRALQHQYLDICQMLPYAPGLTIFAKNTAAHEEQRAIRSLPVSFFMHTCGAQPCAAKLEVYFTMAKAPCSSTVIGNLETIKNRIPLPYQDLLKRSRIQLFTIPTRAFHRVGH